MGSPIGPIHFRFGKFFFWLRVFPKKKLPLPFARGETSVKILGENRPLGHSLQARFSFPRKKTGFERAGSCRKTVPVFPSQEIVTNFEKQGAVRSLPFFPLHEKNGGRKKNRTELSKSDKDALIAKDIYLLHAPRRAGPIYTHQNTEATQHKSKSAAPCGLRQIAPAPSYRFINNLAAKMPFEKTAWCFALQEWL